MPACSLQHAILSRLPALSQALRAKLSLLEGTKPKEADKDVIFHGNAQVDVSASTPCPSRPASSDLEDRAAGDGSDGESGDCALQPAPRRRDAVRWAMLCRVDLPEEDELDEDSSNEDTIKSPRSQAVGFHVVASLRAVSLSPTDDVDGDSDTFAASVRFWRDLGTRVVCRTYSHFAWLYHALPPSGRRLPPFPAANVPTPRMRKRLSLWFAALCRDRKLHQELALKAFIAGSADFSSSPSPLPSRHAPGKPIPSIETLARRSTLTRRKHSPKKGQRRLSPRKAPRGEGGPQGVSPSQESQDDKSSDDYSASSAQLRAVLSTSERGRQLLLIQEKCPAFTEYVLPCDPL